MKPISNFVYCSQLAPDRDVSCVADIIKVARSFNKQHDITGMLVFDGLRFCQYIEGPSPALQNLIDSIAKDPRHVDFTPKFSSSQDKRLFSNWSMAYVLVDDSEPLDELNAIEGQEAIAKLQALIPMLDIG